jgi:hypothetical protein
LHALAVDEHREAFEPTPWRQQKFADAPTPTEQVWFAGAHADVGGGYLDEEKRKTEHPLALDDITLDWMLRRVLNYFPDFPVTLGGKHEWPQVTADWALAPQHEARTGLYMARPFALRSIGNRVVHIERGKFQSNVCHDRHADPIGEMIHISTIARLGELVGLDDSKQIYAPKNLLATFDTMETPPIGTEATNTGLQIVDWSGEPLGAIQSTTVMKEARGRLARIATQPRSSVGWFSP